MIRARPSAGEQLLPTRSNLIDMLERARYLPREGYTSMPWRNGTGTTRQIAREPAQAEAFAWRLSVASLTASGPFSSYPGYQRAVALVEGRGFRLVIKDARAQVLCARGEHALFAGAAQTDCELLDGPCTDLSLMVREPGRINAIAQLHIDGEQMLQVSRGTMQALFVLQGAIECRALLPPIPECEPAAHAYALHFNDTLLIHGYGDCWSLKQVSSKTAELLTITFAPPGKTADMTGTCRARTGVAANT
jgi:uncharacterized protein